MTDPAQTEARTPLPMIETDDQYPQLLPWVQVVRGEGRLLFQHGSLVVVLEGAAARTLLPELVPLLDGTRSVHEIVTYLGPTIEPAVTQALDLLRQHGLLLDGDQRDSTPVCATVNGLSASTGGRAQPELLRDALGDATVLIAGSSAVAAEIANLLEQAGVGTVQRGGVDGIVHDAWTDPPPTREGEPLLIAAPDRSQAELLPWLNQVALSPAGEVPVHERRWMMVLPWDGRFTTVGPIFVPDRTGCYHCFSLRRRSALSFREEAKEIETAAPEDRIHQAAAVDGVGQVAVAAGLAADLALRYVVPADLVASPALGAAFTVSWGELGMETARHRLLRVPRCEVCSRVADRSLPQPWAPANDAEVLSS